MTQFSYRLMEPATRLSCVVFASPHSGKAYPGSFLAQTMLDERAIRSSEDAFVDQLIAAAPTMGAPLIVADVPRAYVDLNRSPDELDPALISGARGLGHNPRVSSGLGVIPRVVANGRAIYRGKITMAAAKERLAQHWYPYHSALQAQLEISKAEFGEAILIDMHSMPHEAIDSISNSALTRPEVVLGDRFGAACAPEIMAQVEAAFVNVGLRVARNTPFAGAYITQHYGRPSRRQHAIQVEIDRALYMNEAAILPSPKFEQFRDKITRAMAEIVRIGRRKTVSLAAE